MSLILLLLCLVAYSSHASKIYKWVDENGQVHYGGNPPPEETKSDEVEIEADNGSSAEAATPDERLRRQQELIRAYGEERRVKNEKKQKENEKRQKLKRNCKIAKDKYNDFLNSRLYKNDKEGNRVYLSEKQREKSLKEFKRNIDKHCN